MTSMDCVKGVVSLNLIYVPPHLSYLNSSILSLYMVYSLN